MWTLFISLLLSLATQAASQGSTFYVSYDSRLIEIAVSNSSVRAGELLPRGYTDARIGRVIGVGCDLEQKLVCWSDIVTKTIRCAQLNKTIADGNKGLDVYTVLTNLNMPEGIALDLCSEALYWTDANDRMVWIARISWNKHKHLEALYQKPIITDLDKPRGIAVDSCAEFVFFTDWSDTDPYIARSSLDGRTVERLLSSPTVVMPNAITLDRQSRLVYFGDTGSQKIYSVGYDGTGLKLVANVLKVFDLALSCSREHLVYTDWTVTHPRRVSLKTGSIDDIPVSGKTNFLFGVCSFCGNCSCHENPCKYANGLCSHFCFPSSNSTHSRTCACPVGYDLHFETTCNDGTDHLVTSYPRSFLVNSWPNSSDTSSSDNESGKPLSINAPNVVVSMDSTVYKAYRYIVYASSTTRAVERITFDGRFHLTLASGLPHPHGVAVDQRTSNVYYSDSRLGIIDLVDFDGRYRVRCVSGLQRAGGLVFDHQTGYLYYTDYGARPSIGRVGGNCANASVVIRSGLGAPVHLTLDETRRVLYWTDPRHRRIFSYNIQTEQTSTVLSGISMGFPFGIFFKNDVLVWTDWTTKCAHYSSVPSLNRTEKLICRPNSTNTPADVTSMHPPVRPSSDFGRCACKPPKFCLTSPTGFVCRCPSGYQADGDKCKLPGPFVVFATSTSLKSMSVKGSSDWIASIPLSPQKRAMAVEYDYRDETVFWSDVNLPASIQSVRFDGSESRTLVKHDATRGVCQLCAPAGLAYDWICRRLYWTDECTGEICYVSLNSADDAITQLVDGLDKPRGITVDPKNGVIYFTDWGSNPRLAKVDLSTCTLEQPNAVTLYNSLMQWPNAVALRTSQFTQALLYGNVGKPSYIGTYIPATDTAHRLFTIRHLFGLDFCNQTLYWTDWATNQVFASKVDLPNATALTAMRGNGIKAICLANQAAVGMRNIDVSVKPNAEIDEGRRLDIECRTSLDLAPKLLVLIKDGDRIKEAVDAPILRHVIKKANTSHSGQYVCRASSHCCSNEKAVTVTVNAVVPPTLPSCKCKKSVDIKARSVCPKKYQYAFKGVLESEEVLAVENKVWRVCYVLNIRAIYKDTKGRYLRNKLKSDESVRICKPATQCCPLVKADEGESVVIVSHAKGNKLELRENAIVVGLDKDKAIKRVLSKCD